MNIAIVEDNNSDASLLISFFNQYEKQYSLKLTLTRYNSGESFLASSFEDFHLVFMDIYMEKLDGIETARRIHEKNTDCLIVFLTTSREDIWRAVKIHACFDYIEKSSLNYSVLEDVLDSARKKLRFRSRILEFHNGKQKIRLPVSKIQYLVSHDKYTCITLEDGQEFTYRVTFSSLCQALEDDARFLLCNRGVLLNMDFIRRTDRETFSMTDGKFFPVRKRNRPEIMQKFGDYQFEKLNELEV